MKSIIQNKLVEKKSLRSFFESTQQDNLDFLGEDAHVVFWSYELKTEEFVVTEGLEKLFGYSSNEISQLHLLNSFLWRVNESLEENLDDYILRGIPFDIEYQAVKKDASTTWVKIKGTPVFNSHNEIIRYNGITWDITAKVLKEAELAEAADQFQTLLEQSAQAVYISQDGKYQYATQQLAEITGYSVDELIGMDYHRILDQKSINLVLERVAEFLSGKSAESQEITVVRKDQSKRMVELRSSVITYKGKPALMGTLLDITEKKQALELANHLAYYDMLTGLPNRNFFSKKTDELLEEAKRKETKVALLFVDLDELKAVNDTFGHHAGDEVLKEAGGKMKELMPDNGFIARYGGDKFGALVPYNTPSDIEELAVKMITEVPLALSSKLKITPTIGISLFPEHGEDAASLLRFADIAMCQSKRDENRQRHYSFCSPRMISEALRINKLANDLKKGIELKQFHLVYQSKVWLDSEKLEGVEALIRWEHPEYGNVSPLDFIPLAEKNGHIIGIGEWVLETAIQDMKKVSMPIMLNVNISMRQLLQHTFVKKMKSLIDRTGFPAERLNLEITESMVIHDVEETIEKLEHLRKLGFKISLDDFGTGYSSLSYLTRLPIDCLKIDGSFVNGLELDESKQLLIRGIIQSVQDLKLEVIAEGIETKKQVEMLQRYKCEMGQGYYFSKPLPFPELLEYIDSQR